MLTHSERILVADNTDIFFHTVRRAKVLLDYVTENSLNDINKWIKEDIPSNALCGDIEAVIDIIDTVSNMLFEAMRDFKLETGADSNDPEIETFFKSVDQYKLNTEVNDLHSQIIDIALKMHGNAAAALWRRREATISMPDTEALPILKELLEEARGGQKNAV